MLLSVTRPIVKWRSFWRAMLLVGGGEIIYGYLRPSASFVADGLTFGSVAVTLTLASYLIPHYLNRRRYPLSTSRLGDFSELELRVAELVATQPWSLDEDEIAGLVEEQWLSEGNEQDLTRAADGEGFAKILHRVGLVSCTAAQGSLDKARYLPVPEAQAAVATEMTRRREALEKLLERPTAKLGPRTRPSSLV